MVGVIGRRSREKIVGVARVVFGEKDHSEGEEDRFGARVSDIEYVRRR